MKRTIIILLIVVSLILLSGCGTAPNPYQQQNMAVIEKALIKETSGEITVCDRYSISETSISLLDCVDDLTEFGQHVVMARVWEETEGKLKGTVVYDTVYFRGRTSGRRLNIFYGYTFQE